METGATDIKLVYAAMANLQLVADALERSRIHGLASGRDAGSGADAAGGDEADQAVTATRVEYTAPPAAQRAAPSFSWDD